MKIRLEGVALLALCGFAMQLIYSLVHRGPHHEATPQELGLALVVLLTGIAGALLLMVGPALFRVYRWPPR